MVDSGAMELTGRFERALAYAARAHAGQRRKGTEIPYVAHLLNVTGIALTAGADEDEAIAALLHDAIEDQGGARAREEIRATFGPRVADIVDACSDTDVEPKPPWRERKEKYLTHLRTASPSARLVSAADKLDNARAILADYRALGDDLWPRFNGGKEGTLWYYRALVSELRAAGDTPLVAELDRVVSELERRALPEHLGLHRMRARLAKAGLACPYVPPDLAPHVQERERWCFATTQAPFWPYRLVEYARAHLAISMPDSVLVAHAGYGMNSYALHYYVVRGPLRLFVQLGWGGGYMPEPETTRGVNRHLALAARLVTATEAALRERRWPPNQMLVVVASDFYGGHWNTSGAFDGKLSADTKPEQILGDAQRWLDGLR